MIALGLVLAFVVAGLIEGFVTGRGVPTGLRVAIGVLVEVAFVAGSWCRAGPPAGAASPARIGELDRGWDELATARERAWSSPA